MSRITDNPNSPELTHGIDSESTGQAKVYLVLSEQERAKGFIRPYRDRYVHVGLSGPQYPLLDVTEDQKRIYGGSYAKYEQYPESELPKMGKFWTQKQLDEVGKGCGTETIMGRALSETWARDPSYYGATYCAGCQMHRPVEEFTWSADDVRLGS